MISEMNCFLFDYVKPAKQKSVKGVMFEEFLNIKDVALKKCLRCRNNIKTICRKY
ncbi:hypothetical protein GLOIN_2v1657642 [Rhizophagus irregularis DAOM 181602=DAOM 197198]|uniref:Uncharacterized protein n=1 Tax=Rhizophagus irregularis (strain DAOM 181602 / DAOM 197198 / MUCL 43194) TaxID=747089 RepID=A0A2P4PLS4_RHIID|nr:hypothetical protein GLOIN_2v1657642 [Rhizophagus irregularis DAOM 181602=DAOM 197198]POG66325.1 hypothetical protein GLOIN_2v1657642 [Rhizophagus irregularis DAOM 181602=DAOM 197198]|eukprot:XP_025173191.1 hypothetical protein GLOIN_2v1657642 [Rhizophagus irregularis DAOM 181602=DAOM 197198]